MNCVQTPAQYSNNGNSLSTPEPHYIPGYLGYVPQAKYRPGHTYGMTSHRVLLDPCVHMSPRSMLTNMHPEHCSVSPYILRLYTFDLSLTFDLFDSRMILDVPESELTPSSVPRWLWSIVGSTVSVVSSTNRT
jgi:hypothetical protein